MIYDFDRIIDRKGTNSVKWNKEHYMEVFNTELDLLPFWVADMDFQASNAILNTVKKILDHGILGYASLDKEYYESIVTWLKKIHDWEISDEDICYTPGVVPSIAYLLEAFTNMDDNIMIFTPVYYPFKEVVLKLNRKIVECPLKNIDKYYTIDFKLAEELIVEKKVKMLIFCSPHNPVGRVWKKEELQKVVDICYKHRVLIISDEVHSDIVFKPNVHIPLLKLKNAEDICVVCNSVGKTFNLAGLMISNVIIKNRNMRDKYINQVNKYTTQFANIFSVEIVKSAYRKSFDWYYEVLDYIKANIDYFENELKSHLPNIGFVKPEGTYLGWLDISNFNISKENINKVFVEELKLAVDYGFWFGETGNNYIRINFACSRVLINNLIDRLKYLSNRE